MNQVPRHEFVSGWYENQAYEDRPLPIGHGQTISQPFIVALMTDLLQVGPDAVVLEVGTGSGYQAAVLAHLVRRVHTIEIIPELAEAPRSASPAWVTTTSAPTPATATTACRSRRRTTASWSPPRPSRYRRP